MKKLLFLFVAIAGVSIYSAQAQTTDKKNADVNAVQNVNLDQDNLKVRTVDADANTQHNRTIDKNSNAAPVSGTKKSDAIIREGNKVIINNESVGRTQPVKSVDKTNDPK